MQPKREPVWRRYLRFWGPDPTSDFDDELQFHLHAKTEELIASGLTPAQAGAEALRQFGPVRPIRRQCCGISQNRRLQTSRAEALAGWLRDLKYAVRTLSRSKPSTTAVFLILALSTGAATGVFTLLDRLVLQPPPALQSSRLLLFSASAPLSLAQFRQLSQNSGSVYLELGAQAEEPVLERNPPRASVPAARAAAVSGSFFDTLAADALWGRTLTFLDQEDSAISHVAVASYRFWTTRFDRSPEALGATVYLNDTPFTIVGVLPRDFAGPYEDAADLYVPLSSSSPGRVRIFGALRPAGSPATALAAMQTVLDRLDPARPAPRLTYREAATVLPGPWDALRRSLWFVAAAALLLLLTAWANAACLLMSRAAARRQETAIHLALGSGKWRMLRQSLIESTLLALAGGAAGFPAAFWAARLLLAALRWERPVPLAPDARVLAFCLGLSLIAGVLLGLAPAWQCLRASSGVLVPGRNPAGRFAAGKVLVAAEVAISLVLVAGAALFLRSFHNLRAEPIGFSTDRISVLNLARPNGQLSAPFDDAGILAQSLRGDPRVEAAGLSDLLPFHDGWIGYTVTLPGASAGAECRVHLLKVDGAYLAALRVPLLMGRTFTFGDAEDAPKVAILSAGAARRLFPGQSPLGRRIVYGGPHNFRPENEMEVVGVVNDIRFGAVTLPAPDLVLQPLLQGRHNTANTSSLKLQVRTSLPPQQVADLVRARIAQLRLPVTVESAATLEDAVLASLSEHRIRMQASALFGVLAMLLIVIGVHGLMTYLVVLRTRELGIRVALGSGPGAVVRLVLRDSLWLAAAGVAAGLPAALLVMQAVSPMLFGLPAFDWVSLAAAVLLLPLTTALASLVPAWRAARLDPIDALRTQ